MNETTVQTTLHLTLLLWSIFGIVAASVLIIGAIFFIKGTIQRKQAIPTFTSKWVSEQPEHADRVRLIDDALDEARRKHA